MVRLKSVLAKNIRARRKALGLTQEAMAEEVGTVSTYIAMIEAEKRTPSFEMIERMAEVLKIEAPELFSTKDFPQEKASQLRKELLERFELFLRAIAKEMGSGE